MGEGANATNVARAVVAVRVGVSIAWLAALTLATVYVAVVAVWAPFAYWAHHPVALAFTEAVCVLWLPLVGSYTVKATRSMIRHGRLVPPPAPGGNKVNLASAWRDLVQERDRRRRSREPATGSWDPWSPRRRTPS